LVVEPPSAPSTSVLATLLSGSDFFEFQEFRGSLVTTRELLVPLTLLETVDPLLTLVPPSTTWVGSSQTVVPDCTVLGNVVVDGPQAEPP